MICRLRQLDNYFIQLRVKWKKAFAYARDNCSRHWGRRDYQELIWNQVYELVEEMRRNEENKPLTFRQGVQQAIDATIYVITHYCNLAIQCNAIQYNAIQCNAIHCSAIRYNAIQYNAIQCNAMPNNTIQCHTMQFNAMSYNAMPHNAVAYVAAHWLETWWRIGWVDAFQPEGCGFESRSSRHVGTLGNSALAVACGASSWNSGTVSVLCR